MKTQIIALLPQNILRILRLIKNRYLEDYSIKSFSQEGEDMILRRLFESQKTGFYVDIGAHHPFRFSNTYIFYKQGWNGINIDAMPGSMGLFNKFRSRDINLEIPVGTGDQVLTYFSFNEPALNGFSDVLSRERDLRDEYFIENQIEMKVSSLSSILDKYLPPHKEIDFLSVDVEGLDFEVLESNDWLKYRPKCILVEILESSIHDIKNNKIAIFLKNNGYEVYAKAINTVFFMQK